MLEYWIWLAHRPGVSDRTKRMLLQHFQDPQKIYLASGQMLSTLPELTAKTRESLLDKNLSASEKILSFCLKENIRLLTIDEKDYPFRLKNIADPPVLLYCRGTLPEFDSYPVIGVVGTRKASLYGMTAAKRLGYQIGRCGGMVVSGLASGIDGQAMLGGLLAGTCVVGVLGCGIDVVYPASNRRLYEDTARYGCILTEFPPGTPPKGHHFPRRNRIISGLSCGVLVVEAPEKSGALITAREALDQGRDVFVVPGNIDVPTFVGSNRLMRDGAIPVSSGWDILSEYWNQYPDKVRRPGDDVPVPAAEDPEAGETPAKVAQKPVKPVKKAAPKEKCNKKVIDKAAQQPYIDLNDILPKLSAAEAAIVTALKDGERLVDDVIAETGLSAGKLLASLTMLELKGIIRRLPGKRISLK